MTPASPAPFVLASGSATRLRVLRDAGLRPEAVFSGMDETTDDGLDTAAAVAMLAGRKADAVALLRPGALVLGCDSLLDLDGEALGKPGTAQRAAALWHRLSGRQGTLFTGHCLIEPGTGRRAQGVGRTVVRFGRPSDAEIAAYVASGEPLALAGGFSLDGLGAPFVDGIDGDPGNVLGLSLPLLRRLLAELGVTITDLWAPSRPLAELTGAGPGWRRVGRARRGSRPGKSRQRAGPAETDADRENGVVMPKAVRFDEYGGIDVLNVVDVPQPEPGPGEVLVQVKAAGINPGESKIREGMLHERWPATFPSGQGADLAGVVAGSGPETAGFTAGDEVFGFVDTRSSQAEYAVVPAVNLTPKPAAVPWEVAGALFVAGSTAYAAVRAVSLGHGDTVVVSGAAGGVGSIAVQLARRAGATVIGLASEKNHEWLAGHGVIPVTYGDGVAARIEQAAGKADAFIDTFGAGYVQLAVEQLGIQPARINTIADFGAVERYGIKAEGSAYAASATVLAELAALIAGGELEVPVAATYPLSAVQDAYRQLETGHILGKIVLIP